MILQRASKDSYLKVPSRNSILSIVEFLTFALHALIYLFLISLLTMTIVICLLMFLYCNMHENALICSVCYKSC